MGAVCRQSNRSPLKAGVVPMYGGSVHASRAGGKTHYASISPKAELKVHIFLFVIYKVVKKSFIAHLSKFMFLFFLRVYGLYPFIAPRPN